MLTIAWTNENTLEFLELYKNEPVLWNPQNKLHKNKTAIRDAWDRILTSFSIPSTIEILKRKKESLKATFRCLYKKKTAFLNSGANANEPCPISWFAFPLMDSFLSPVYEGRNSLNMETPTKDKREIEEICTEISNDSINLSSSTSSQFSTKQSQELITPKEEMDDPLSMFSRTVSREEPIRKRDDDDECDLYCKLLSKRLKKFDESIRDNIMQEIDQIIYQAKQKYNSASTVVSSPECKACIARRWQN